MWQEINDFSSVDIDKAITSGFQYLLSQRKNGKWTGFSTMAGTSDIWVTGFILTHISSLKESTELFQSSYQFLVDSQHESGGWSYSKIVPPDSDSTSWCISALKPTPYFTRSVHQASTNFLWSNLSGKGLATYGPGSKIKEFISAPSDDLLKGWTSPHPDVSAAAMLADPESKHADHLQKWLEELCQHQGFIKSYWWRNLMYTTALYLRYLRLKSMQLSPEWREKLLILLKLKQLQCGGFNIDGENEMDPFVTALAIEILVYLLDFKSKKTIIKSAKTLIGTQLPDGSWKGNFNMRIPAPFVIDPEQVESYHNSDIGGNSLVMDEGGLFATALSCYSLNLVQNYLKTAS